MNKRGALLQMVQFIDAFKLFILVLIGGALIIITLQPPKVPEEPYLYLKSDLYLEQLVNHPGCFATGTGALHDIDPSKVTDNTMDRCLSLTRPLMTIPATFTLQAQNPITADTSTAAGATYNQHVINTQVMMNGGQATAILAVNTPGDGS
ncbi:hypothetical protein JXA12_02490 [Candidatus Woesearchaeota archaeon]|nr:hypothetical protein [Candidatus Woesearchaeota archaeon]